MKSISLLWEIPLALLSFLFYKVMKLIIGNLFTIYLALNREKASQWRVLSQEIINSPLTLPVLMTKGPRWNTHAIIGTLGPFRVEKSIALDTESANNSAQSWIAVVYSFPGYKTITSIESTQVDAGQKWHFLELKPGKYSFGLRYYRWNDRVDLPVVKVDEQLLVDVTPVPGNVNQFYHHLIQAKNWFYSSLHYYIFTILKLRRWLPESFVNKEFLPVGAPDTQFFYNYLAKNQSLQIDIDTNIIDAYDLYFTLYDRSSLPLTWCCLGQAKHTFEPAASDGYYLLRIRPQPGTVNKTVNFELTKEEKNNQTLKISW